jgi:hypothetical protein
MYPPVIYLAHEYLLQNSLYPSPTRIPMACSNIDKYSKDPKDIEELRHLTFKEYEGTKVVKDIIFDDVSSSYTKPLKLWKVNIRSE